MVADEVEAKVDVTAEVVDIDPVAVGGVDGSVVDDGEAVVGGVGEERQQVDDGDEVGEAVFVETTQGFQRRGGGLAEVVGIGDEQDVTFVEEGVGGAVGAEVAVTLQEVLQAAGDVGGVGAVEEAEFVACFGLEHGTTVGNRCLLRGRLPERLPRSLGFTKGKIWAGRAGA